MRIVAKQRANRFKVVDLPTVQKWPANSVKHDQLLDVCTSILDNLVSHTIILYVIFPQSLSKHLLFS